MFVLQLLEILLGPQFNKSFVNKLPYYFTSTAAPSKTKHQDDVAFCTYPLLSTIFLGLFATYLFWLGRWILNLVINKGLQKRVYTLLFSVSSFFPLRVLFLGLSVLSKPKHFPFQALAFLAFLSLLCCAGVGICMLVYCPVADCLALRSLQDIEASGRISDEYNDTISLIANQGPVEETVESSSRRNSAASTKRGSISFRAMERDETSGSFIELSLCAPSQHSTPPNSPWHLGWPMFPPTHLRGP